MPFRLLCAAVVALGAGTAAHAATLTLPDQPATSLFGDGTSLAADPSLAGTIVADLTTRFSYDASVTPPGCVGGGCAGASGLVTGSIESRVVRNASGHDDFYWRISVDPGSFSWVQSAALVGLPAGSYTIDWRSDDGGGAAPGYAATFTPGVLSLEWVAPLDRGAIRPGAHSPWVVLRTNASSFASDIGLTLFTDTDGAGEGVMSGHSGSLATFGPIAAVPEPAGRALFAMGLLVIARLWRQRGRPR
jgi:hypothetical protein